MNTHMLFKTLMICCVTAMFFTACKQKDAEIQTQLNEKLISNPDLSGVTATVDNGTVTLNGEVKSADAKMSAEAAAKEVKGVQSIKNNIAVDSLPPPPPPPAFDDDTTITNGIADATKDFPTVTATVNGGEVTLTGTIKEKDLDRLMQSMNSLNVKKINNQLTIEK